MWIPILCESAGQRAARQMPHTDSPGHLRSWRCARALEAQSKVQAWAGLAPSRPLLGLGTFLPQVSVS